jgi:hypothetical protein
MSSVETRDPEIVNEDDDYKCHSCEKECHNIIMHPFKEANLCEDCSNMGCDKQCPEKLHGRNTAEPCDWCWPEDESNSDKED